MPRGVQGGAPIGLDTSPLANLGEFGWRALSNVLALQQTERDRVLKMRELAANEEYMRSQTEAQNARTAAMMDAARQKAETNQRNKLLELANSVDTADQFRKLAPLLFADAPLELVEAGATMAEISTKRRKEQEKQAERNARSGSLPGLMSEATPDQLRRLRVAREAGDSFEEIMILGELSKAVNEREHREKLETNRELAGQRIRFVEETSTIPQRPKGPGTTRESRIEDQWENVLQYNDAPLTKENAKVVPYLRTPTLVSATGSQMDRISKSAQGLDSLARAQALFDVAAEQGAGGLVAHGLMKASRAVGKDLLAIRKQEFGSAEERASALAHALDTALKVSGLISVNLFSGAAFTDKQLAEIMSMIANFKEANPSTMRAASARIEAYVESQLDGLTSAVPRYGSYPSIDSDELTTPYERARREAASEYRKRRVSNRKEFFEKYGIGERGWE